MMMALLAKIIKQSWFDYPEMQVAVNDLSYLLEVNKGFKMILDGK